MKTITGPLKGIAALTAAFFFAGVLAGCSTQPRRWGACGYGGAALGALVGAGTGYAIAYATRGGHSGSQPQRPVFFLNGATGFAPTSGADDSSQPPEKIAGAASAGGAVLGILIGATVGHYLCDPVIQPTP